MKIYTRRGDRGETDLFGGGRVAKDDLRVEAYGAVDELNAFIGVCAAATSHADLREILLAIQGRLFGLGGNHRSQVALFDSATTPPACCRNPRGANRHRSTTWHGSVNTLVHRGNL